MADYRAACLRCPATNPAGIAAANQAAAQMAAAATRSLDEKWARDREARAAHDKAAADPSPENIAAAAAARTAAEQAATTKILRAPFCPMMNFRLARRYPSPDIGFERPSLVQQELLQRYFAQV